MSSGFRPGDPAIPLAAPLDEQHGIDPREPKTTLEVPSPEVMHAVKDLWAHHKKQADVILVLDVSGSMKEQDKIVHARAGAVEFLSQLGDGDAVSVLAFNHELRWVANRADLATERAALSQKIEGLFADGGTALYDAIAAAYEQVQQSAARGRIQSIVVLSDGDDRNSKLDLQTLLDRIGSHGEPAVARVFTIGYGREARSDVLQRIADATQARFYAGKPEDIREVFKEISTFF